MKEIRLDGTANAQQVFEMLDLVGHAGQNIVVEWARPANVRKGVMVNVSKRTIAGIRYGLDYANLKPIREGIAAGTRGEVESLPWGQWRKGYENRIIDHKGNEYCRFCPASFENMPRKSEWLIDGREATLDEVKPYLLASEYKRDYEVTCTEWKAGERVILSAESEDDAREIAKHQYGITKRAFSARPVLPLVFCVKPATIQAIYYNE